ncbi:MAG TPA: NADPH:quinone reductase [Sphingobium sp.]
MKAAYYERQGKAVEVLCIGEVPLPEPGPGEVRVAIHVSGVNPTDIKARTGFSSAMAFPRIIPHQDGAGVIDAVGAGVPASRIGERVWVYEAQYGRDCGTAAEFAVVDSAKAVPLPAGISFEIGASLGIPAITAYHCLFADGDIRGKRILVHGGAGVVGSAVTMLAKWAGAWVVTTVIDDAHIDAAQAAGADLILNIRVEDVAARVKAETGGEGVDRIIDVALLHNLEIDMACLKTGGFVVSYATGDAKDRLPLPLLDAMIGGCVFRFVYIYNATREAKREATEAITACLKDGAYAPIIGLNVSLDAIAEAHDALDSGAMIGKALVSVRNPTVGVAA